MEPAPSVTGGGQALLVTEQKHFCCLSAAYNHTSFSSHSNQFIGEWLHAADFSVIVVSSTTCTSCMTVVNRWLKWRTHQLPSAANLTWCNQSSVADADVAARNGATWLPRRELLRFLEIAILALSSQLETQSMTRQKIPATSQMWELVTLVADLTQLTSMG